jgi:hypothetical protein
MPEIKLYIWLGFQREKPLECAPMLGFHFVLALPLFRIRVTELIIQNLHHR